MSNLERLPVRAVAHVLKSKGHQKPVIEFWKLQGPLKMLRHPLGLLRERSSKRFYCLYLGDDEDNH